MQRCRARRGPDQVTKYTVMPEGVRQWGRLALLLRAGKASGQAPGFSSRLSSLKLSPSCPSYIVGTSTAHISASFSSCFIDFCTLPITGSSWKSGPQPDPQSLVTDPRPPMEVRVTTDSSCPCVSVSDFSCVRFFATVWTMAHQAPLSMGFSRQEY